MIEKPQIHIFDHLAPHPEFTKTYGKIWEKAEFKDIESQGQTYSDMSQDISHEFMHKYLAEHMGFTPVNVVSFLRAYRDIPEYRHPMWIHTDTLFADYIGIYFIKSSEFYQDDGVSFWQHRNGLYGLDTKDHTGYINEMIDRDSLHPRRWELWKHVAFRRNRMVVAPAAAFHSKATYGNFGKTYKDCRIVHVTFFNKGE